MFSICLPRVTSHYSEIDIRDAINIGLDGDFVSTIDIRPVTDSKGQEFQMVFVHFWDKEGNEKTDEFFGRLEKDREVKFYTGATDKRRWLGKDVPNPKFGSPFYWKVRKNTSKRQAPGLVTEELLEAAICEDGIAMARCEEGEPMCEAVVVEVRDLKEDEDEEGEVEE
jgi:hypothetical protein